MSGFRIRANSNVSSRPPIICGSGGDLSSIASDLDMKNFKITDVAAPTLGTDAVNKDYADALAISGGFVATADTDLDMDSYSITNLADPTAPQGAATKAYVDSNAGGEGGPVQTFLVDSLVEPPVAVWPNATDLYLNQTVIVQPFTTGTGWDSRTITLSIVSGSLPNGMTLDTDANSINYSYLIGTPDTISTGTVDIKSENPAGSYTYTLTWEVQEPHGIAEFTNSEEIYTALRSDASDFTSINFAKIEGLTGGIDSSYVFTNTEPSQVYYHFYPVPSDTYSHAYLMQHADSSYWYMFKSNVEPVNVVNGLDLADSLSSTAYELTTSDSEHVTIAGIKYPVDNDLTWITAQHYIDFGNDVSLNGFMSRNQNWSYGFRVIDTILGDFLGRPMFCRNGGNYLGWKAFNDTYEFVFFGNDASPSLFNYTSPSVTIPIINAGDWVVVSSVSGDITFYINGTAHLTAYSVGSEWSSDILSNLQDLHFGRSVISNQDVGNRNQEVGSGFWQGKIEYLFICNGTALSSTQVSEISELPASISTSTNYVLVTHAWTLRETTGSSFASLKGGVPGVGAKI